MLMIQKMSSPELVVRRSGLEKDSYSLCAVDLLLTLNGFNPLCMCAVDGRENENEPTRENWRTSCLTT